MRSFFFRVSHRANGEHPVEMIDEVVAVFVVKMRQDLGVGLCVKFMAAFFEIGSHLAVIVELAVHHHDDASGLR